MTFTWIKQSCIRNQLPKDGIQPLLLCQEPRSYIITTEEGIQYRKTKAHLKPYNPQDKTSKSELLAKKNHMQTVKNFNYKQSGSNLAQSRPKRDIKPPIKLDL